MANEVREPVVVYVARTPTLAEIVRAKLESFGIHAVLQYQSAGRVLGLTVDGWGQTRVVVPAAQAEEARALLAEEPPEQESGETQT